MISGYASGREEIDVHCKIIVSLLAVEVVAVGEIEFECSACKSTHPLEQVVESLVDWDRGRAASNSFPIETLLRPLPFGSLQLHCTIRIRRKDHPERIRSIERNSFRQSS